MSGVSLRVPPQLVPEPLNVTGTVAPLGGPKLRSGLDPGCGGSVNCRLTATLVLLVAWIGGKGAVLMTPE